MPTPPDVSGVGPNWYVTATWTNTLVPAVNTAQGTYNADQANLNNFLPTYNTDKQTLQNLLNATPPSPTDSTALQAAIAALQTARDKFNLDQENLNQLLTTLSQDANNLVTAQTNAETYVDSLSDSDYQSFVTQLQSEIGSDLTLAATVPTGYDTALTEANNLRISTRSAFLSSLSGFQTAEQNLSNSRVDLLSLQDQLLVSQATSQMDLYQTQIDQNTLVGYQQQLISDTNALPSGDSRLPQLSIINADVQAAVNDLNTVTQDLSTVPVSSQLAADQATLNAAQVALNSAEAALSSPGSTFSSDFSNINGGIVIVKDLQSTLQTDQGTASNLTNQVTMQSSTVNNDGLLRGQAQGTLESKYVAYSSAINGFVNVLTEAGQLAESSPTTFLQDLANAQAQAATLEAAALNQAQVNDSNLNAAHFQAFPSVNQNIESAISSIFSGTNIAVNSALDSSLTKPMNVVSQINFPELPAGKSMTIKELMAFISLIQVMLQELIRSLRQSDDNVNELRFLLFNIASGSQSTADSLSLEYQDTLHAADEKYDQQVATDNFNNSTAAVNSVTQFMQNIPQINQVIDQLNQEIDAQNQRGIDVVTDLNSSTQIATDTLNQLGLTEPNAYNENNIQGQDTNLPYPQTLTAAPAFPAPTQLDPLPELDPTQIQIPSTLPTPVLDPSGALPQTLPGSATTPVLPATQADVDTLNNSIAYIDKIIEPLLPRLQAAGLDLSLIDPLFLRPYIPIRSPTDVIDFGTLTGFTSWFLSMILLTQNLGTASGATPGSTIPVTFFTSLEGLQQKPAMVPSVSQAGNLGTSTSILSANLFAGAGIVGQALTSALNSTSFQDLFQQILSQATLIGGIASLSDSAPPASIANWSQLGVVESDESAQVGAAADARVTYENGLPVLTPQQITAVTSTITELVNNSNNIPALKSGILNLLSTQGPQGLSQAQIQQLISLLLYILQLLSLLVGALVATAAGGKTNIDHIVQKAFPNAVNENLVQVTHNLANLGVKGLPVNVAPSKPVEFLPAFFNAVTPELTPAEQAGFVAQVTTVFNKYNITLNGNAPLGTAVQEALAQVPTPTELTNVTAQLNLIASNEASQVQAGILNDAKRNQALGADVIAANNIAFSNLSAETIKTTNETLNKLAPEISGLSKTSRNNLVLALATGTISPEQAKSFVDTFLQQKATSNNPHVGFLLGLATQSHLQARAAPAVPTAPVVPTPVVPTAPVVPTPVVPTPVVPTAARVPIQPTVTPPVTPAAVTPVPVTPVPVTAQVVTPAPVTPPVTPVTPLPVTAQPVTTHPVTTQPVTTQPGTPGNLPDVNELLVSALKNLSKQTTDNNFTSTVTNLFADLVRDQTDFYHLSLGLVLSPSGVFTKNFSIRTQDKFGGGSTSPLQIPISG